MATVNDKYITMLDIMSSAGTLPGEVVDMTSQMNPILTDAPAFECNMGTFHRVPIKKGLGKFVWGKSYQGVPTSKGRMEHVDFTTGYAESELEVAKKEIDDIENYVRFQGMRGQARKNAVGMEKSNQINEQQATHAQTLAIGVANALFYEDQAADPKRITGFMPFYNSLSGERASQIINAGGKGTENCSMWMLTWHKKANFLIYPRGAKSHGGMKVGKLQESFNLDTDPQSDGYMGKYDTYRKKFEWHTGLVSADFRYTVRIGGIDVTTLDKGAAATGLPNTSADLIDLMTDAHYQHMGRRMLMGKTCWYMGTTPIKFLDYQARNTPKNLELTLHQTGTNAKEVLAFRNAPIKETDALHNHEDGIAA